MFAEGLAHAFGAKYNRELYIYAIPITMHVS